MLALALTLLLFLSTPEHVAECLHAALASHTLEVPLGGNIAALDLAKVGGGSGRLCASAPRIHRSFFLAFEGVMILHALMEGRVEVEHFLDRGRIRCSPLQIRLTLGLL